MLKFVPEIARQNTKTHDRFLYFWEQNKAMVSFFKKYKIFILTMVLFSIAFLAISYRLLNPKKTLPIMNPADVNPELVDSTVQHVSKYHTIADFSFTNQNGNPERQNPLGKF